MQRTAAALGLEVDDLDVGQFLGERRATANVLSVLALSATVIRAG